MKVTKELKDIIDRKLSDMETEEENAIRNEREALVDKMNADLVNSDEMKALRSAAEAWEAKVKSIADANKELVARNSSSGRYYRDASATTSWNLSEELKCETIRPLRALSDKECRFKYINMRDSIIMRLSYGKDFDEAKTILAEYGIEI